MMTAAESTDLFKAKPIVKTDPIPDSLIVLELVRKHDTPDLIESANFFISTISVGYRSLFNYWIIPRFIIVTHTNQADAFILITQKESYSVLVQ